MAANPMAPSVTGSVGKIIFSQLPPNWNESTIVWRVIPIRSASGAKIGMVSTALLEPDGIKKSITVCNIMAAHDAQIGCNLEMPLDIKSNSVSKICPFCAMMTIACAKHNVIAIEAIPRTPSKKLSVAWVIFSPPKIAAANPIPRNSAAISVMYQPSCSK